VFLVFKPFKKRLAIKVPPNVDAYEITLEEEKIILNPVYRQRKNKRSLNSVKGILNGEFLKKYGKPSAHVIRDSRNEE